MRGYRVTAKHGNDTIKFDLPIDCEQDTIGEALISGRKMAMEAYGLVIPDYLKIVVEEVYLKL